MAIPRYDELVVRLEPAGGGRYQVRASGPDGSTGRGWFTSPVSEVELDNFILRVARPRAVRAAHTSDMDEAKELGGALFERLLCDDVGDVYQGARKVAESQGRGLRITLSMTEAPELLEIPWELLYDRGAASFLSDSIFTPVVRTLDLKNPPAPPELMFPFKVLGIVSSPSEFPPLDTQAERAKLETALASLIEEGAVELEWLETATLSELDRRIGAPDDLHVIHYIGHGAYDKKTRGGILALEDAQGAPHEVSGEDLGRSMKDERSLRLVVLNSCEGARASHIDPFSGVATSLLRCGLPAVIGMQAEITDEAAIAFSDRLYTALAQGFPVDAALAQARRAIAAAGKGVEFSTPVLFMRVSDGRIFNVTDVLPAPRPRQPGRIEAALRAEPETVPAGGAVTWRLEIRNAGGSRLADVEARDRGGETRAGPLQLDAGATHETDWTEIVESDVDEQVTVEGRGADGQLMTEEARARVDVVRGGAWWPPSKRVLVAGGGALAALLVLVVALAVLGGDDDGGGGGGGGSDFRAYSVKTDVPDLDARGEKLAYLVPAGEGDSTAIMRLDLTSGRSEPVDPEPIKHDGLDMGLNQARRAQLVYSSCPQPSACDVWRRPFRGEAARLPSSGDECSERRPSMWAGLVLFVRSGPNCTPQLVLARADSPDFEPIAGDTRGADLNDGVIAWLSQDGALAARGLDTSGEVSPQGTLRPKGTDAFTTPIVVEDEYVYFVHAQGSQTYIARARLPLDEGSQVEHYSPGEGIGGAEDAPHFTVTANRLFTTNYPQPDGESGSRKIARITNPKFEPAG